MMFTRTMLRTFGFILIAAQVLATTKDAPVKWDRQSDWVDEPPPNMPRVTKLEVICGKQHMTIHLAFNQPFHGLVFSKGKHRENNCVYVGPNSGRAEFVFDVYYDDCGTKPDLHGNFYENTVIIQYGTDIIEAWDEAKRLRCEWHNAYEKPAAQPPPVHMADLDVVELNFQGDNIDCWMEIQEGKGPWSREVSNLIPLGSPLTMVIAINDQEGQFDMRVKSCFAHDGHKVPIQLTDEWGCVLRPKMLSPFHKVRDYNSRASVVSYAHFYAFKFPDTMDVHIQCKVEICRHGCPDSCQKTAYKPIDVHHQRHPDGNELDVTGGGYETKHVTVKTGSSNFKVSAAESVKTQSTKTAIYNHQSSSPVKAVHPIKDASEPTLTEPSPQNLKSEVPYKQQASKNVVSDSSTLDTTDHEDSYHYAPEAMSSYQQAPGSASHTVYHQESGASIQSPYHKYTDSSSHDLSKIDTTISKQTISEENPGNSNAYVPYNESPPSSTDKSQESSTKKSYTVYQQSSSDIKPESLKTIHLSGEDGHKTQDIRRFQPPATVPEPQSLFKPVILHQHHFQSQASQKQEMHATPRGQNEKPNGHQQIHPGLFHHAVQQQKPVHMPVPIPEHTQHIQQQQHSGFISQETQQHFVPPVLYKPPRPHYPYPIPQFVPQQPLFVKFTERVDHPPIFHQIPVMLTPNPLPQNNGFHQGPRSLRLRRSTADGREIGVSQVYRAVASIDLAFQPNATADNTVVYEGRFEEIVYGVCLPITGLALGFGFLLVLTAAALCVCGYMVYHYRLQNYREKSQTLLSTHDRQGRRQFLYRGKIHS